MSTIRRIPNAGTWAGLVLVVVGFVLIAIAWGRTAGQVDVSLQMPYLMSAGLTGLALVVIGVTVIGIDARVRESTARQRDAHELREAIADLRLRSEDAA